MPSACHSQGRNSHTFFLYFLPLGELPSDELLQEVVRLATPPGFPPPKIGVKLPNELRDTISQVITPSVTALSEAGVLPILNQAVVTLEQIPKLVDEVRYKTVDCVRMFGLPHMPHVRRRLTF
jgi:hypothetical protein